jgi:hypothetical protein
MKPAVDGLKQIVPPQLLTMLLSLARSEESETSAQSESLGNFFRQATFAESELPV